MAERAASELLAAEGVEGWKDYFQLHDLLPFFSQLLATLGEQKPEDPYAYISTYSGRHIPTQGALKADRVHEYFDTHGLKLFFVRMLMELGKMEPQDPYAFMVRYITENAVGDGRGSGESITRGSRGNRSRQSSKEYYEEESEGGDTTGDLRKLGSPHHRERKSSMWKLYSIVRRNDALDQVSSAVEAETSEIKSFFKNWVDDEPEDDVDAEIGPELSGTSSTHVTKDALKALLSWDTDILGTPNTTLVRNVFDIIKLWGLIDTLGLNSVTMKSYIQAVFMGYNKNPYHNFKHAFAIMAATGYFLRFCVPSRYFTPLEHLSFLIAALTHDVGHESFNNDFYVKSRHELAIRYNDSAVLENMHAAYTYELAQADENNWFKGMSTADYQICRKLIITAILATDMKVHFDLTNSLIALAETMGPEGMEEADQTDTDTKNLLVRTIVHAADISNPVLKSEFAHQWAYRVVLEFHGQANAEKSLGLEYAPFMEPHPDSTVNLASLQVGFIQFIVQPFWSPLSKVFPPLKERMDQLELNVQYWTDVRDKAKAEEAAKAGDQPAA